MENNQDNQNNQKTQWVKLRDLQDFTVNKVFGYNFKQWDNENKQMLTSDTPKKGFRKMWQLETDKGKLELSDGQLGQMLSAAFDKEKSVVIGRTFEVRTNGKQGMDIRYFINLKREDDYSQPSPEEEEVDLNDVDNIPF